MVNKCGKSRRKPQNRQFGPQSGRQHLVMPFLFELVEVLKKVPGGLFGGHGGTEIRFDAIREIKNTHQATSQGNPGSSTDRATGGFPGGSAMLAC